MKLDKVELLEYCELYSSVIEDSKVSEVSLIKSRFPKGIVFDGMNQEISLVYLDLSKESVGSIEFKDWYISHCRIDNEVDQVNFKFKNIKFGLLNIRDYASDINNTFSNCKSSTLIDRK